MSNYDNIRCTTCGVPHQAYHQVESALLRAIEVLVDIRAPGGVPAGRVAEVEAQARAALRLDVPASAGGARAAGAGDEDGGPAVEVERLRAEARRLYRADGSYEELGSPEGVVARRVEAAREFERLEAENRRLRAGLEQAQAALTRSGIEREELRTERDELRGLFEELDREYDESGDDPFFGNSVREILGRLPEVRGGSELDAGTGSPEPPPEPPAPTVHEGQALLVAVGPSGRMMALAAAGEMARDLLHLKASDDRLGEIPGWSRRDVDEAPDDCGLHVWEGSIAEIPVGNSDGDFEGYEYEWSGAWRPARAGDLARFGLGEVSR